MKLNFLLILCLAMEVLDGDEVRLTDCRGRVAERDIVQVKN